MTKRGLCKSSSCRTLLPGLVQQWKANRQILRGILFGMKPSAYVVVSWRRSALVIASYACLKTRRQDGGQGSQKSTTASIKWPLSPSSLATCVMILQPTLASYGHAVTGRTQCCILLPMMFASPVSHATRAAAVRRATHPQLVLHRQAAVAIPLQRFLCLNSDVRLRLLLPMVAAPRRVIAVLLQGPLAQ